MQVRVLGDLVVEVADVQADLGGPKPRTLFALLVVGAGRPVPVERLVDQVWGSEPPARVEASLQSYVARIRRALEREPGAGRQGGPLRTHAGGYSLELGNEDVDARRFLGMVDEARALAEDDTDAAVTRLGEALGLWRGAAYAGLAAPVLEAEAVRLEELRMSATDDYWSLRLALGHQQAAVPELEQLVRLHPLREGFWALLARALYADARQGDALAALRRAREHLVEELGVDPGVELRDLEQAILRQDRVLEPQVRARTAATSAPVTPTTSDRPPLPGRGEHLRLAEGALAQAATGTGRTILLTGEAGIGKSRLAQELAARASAAGFRVGRGGWESEPSPALWGWTRALREAIGEEPELALVGGGGDATAAAFRQAQAVLGHLAGAPTLLILDDVHWADAESLRLLARVAPGVRDVPAVLLAAVRMPGDVSGLAAEALGTLARTDPLRLDLTGLDASAVALAVSGQSGLEMSEEATAELARRTDGNPLYVGEMVRYLVTAGALDDLGNPAWAGVPSGVRDVVRHRLLDLPEAWTSVLVTAATIGRTVDVALVERVEGDTETVAAALETAQIRGLLEEIGPHAARFTHALVRDALYESAPASTRARLHAAVAAAGEVLYAGRIADHAAELADHYRRAGPSQARSAWLMAERAARSATARTAHDEAASWLEVAVDQQLDDEFVVTEERERVLVALARARVRRGHPVAAWEPAREATHAALTAGRPEDAAASLLAVTEGMVWGWRPAPTWDDEAIDLWRAVLDAHPGPTITRARLAAALATELLYRPDSTAEATRLADEAVSLVRRIEPAGPTALGVFRLAHSALLRPELVHHRMVLAEEVVGLSTTLREVQVLAGALTARAQDRAELGRWDEARSDVTRAADVSERERLPEPLIVAGWCEATIRLAEGDLVGAEQTAATVQALQETLTTAAGGIELSHLAMLRDAQGRLGELEPLLGSLRHLHPALRELHALALAHTGDLDRLRREVGGWSDQPSLTRDYSWLFLTAVRAETWVLLGDQTAAADLSEQLAPFEDRVAVTLAMGLRGAVSHWSGRLAAFVGDVDAARRHLRAARTMHADLGLSIWLERTETALTELGPAAGEV